VSAAQQEAFNAMFAQFMYVSLTPLRRLESPEMKAALALLGATPPDRRQVAGPLLNNAYNQAVNKVVSKV
jgi:hypothetical protein